jgi:polysaccharide deacetylase family protein (PEP-CTERM system associated)
MATTLNSTDLIRSAAATQNGISVDLEDWYALVARRLLGQEQAPSSRVVIATHRLLDLFDKTATKATFFVLGTVAEAFPELVREVADRGHEIATHGYAHRRLDTIGERAFRDDLRRSVNAIGEACGVLPRGHRAPEFTIMRDTMWAFEVLADEGFAYDSSVFPIRHRRYGISDAPRGPYTQPTPAGPLLELPLATLALFGQRLPTAGGGYLRFFPYLPIDLSVSRANASGVPAVLYVHPYEFDPEPLVMRGPTLKGHAFVVAQNAFRHRAPVRLERLLRRFPFGPLGDIIDG